LDTGRLSAAKQASTSVSASANPSSGSLNVACAALTSIIGTDASLRTNCPSAPSSITTSFGPTTIALASLRSTGCAINSIGKVVCGFSSHSWEPRARR
jgi:hypothetical protein